MGLKIKLGDYQLTQTSPGQITLGKPHLDKNGQTVLTNQRFFRTLDQALVYTRDKLALEDESASVEAMRAAYELATDRLLVYLKTSQGWVE